jgi:putative FmdB family regulatory protein
MPIYEYRCANCKRKVSIFWRSFSVVDESKARCTYCGSARLSRLASRVRVIRGGSRIGGSSDAESGTADAGADMDDSFMNDLNGLDENDPRQLGHFMRKMAAQAGEEMPAEFDEIVGRLEKGEDPEKIEQSMGDLLGEPGSDMPGSGMMDDEMAPPPPAEQSDVGERGDDKAASTKDKSARKTARRAVRAKTSARSAAKSKAKRK